MKQYKNLIIFVLIAIAVGLVIWWFFGSSVTKSSGSDTQAEADTPITIAAVGDIACPPEKAVTEDKCQMQAVARAVSAIKPVGVLLLGDLQYTEGELENFNAVFDKLWDKSLKLYPVPGNHEYITQGAAGYFEYFKDFRGEDNNGYYAFDIGKWRVYALNSNCEYVGGCGEGSPQATWLEQDLALHKNRCVAAMWHHPTFTSGPHDDEDSVERGKYFWQLLDKYHADVILNGHDHLYERLARQHADTSVDNRTGIRQFTAGAGGYSKYAFKNVLKNQEYGNDKLFGFLRLDLYDNKYSWQYIDTTGNILDSGTNTCSLNFIK